MIVRIGGVGKSFQGAYSYYMHDKDHALTSKRVEWSTALNTSTDNTAFALHEMIDTAQNAHEIQQHYAGKKSAQKIINPVYTFSLSWHESENPTREEMLEAGRSALKAVGLDNRQVIIVAHNDENYKHIHLLVNRVDPITGRVDGKKTISNDRLKFSKWADNYERERGQNFCPERRKNCLKRENGEYVKYLDDGLHRIAKHEAQKAFKDQSWKDYSQEKQAEYKRLVDLKRQAIQTRLKALQKKHNFKGQWADHYQQVRTDQREQKLAHRKNVQKLKDVLANKYGIYKANLYDQRGLVSRPFNYHAGQTESKAKHGKIYNNLRPSRYLRDKKEKLLKAQALERKKVIEQINKEFAPRFNRLKKTRTMAQLKQQRQRTGGLSGRFNPTSEREKARLNPAFTSSTQSHESQKSKTANDNSQSEGKERTRNRSKERTKRKERTRSRERQP